MNAATSSVGPRAGTGPRRPRHWGRWLLAVLALLVVGAALVDWNTLIRHWAERTASEKTGRTVHIGALHIPLRLPLSVEVRDVSISNPSWASSPVFFDVKRAVAQVRLLPLLRRELVVPSAELDAPRLFLEQQGERRTWVFGSGEKGESIQPQIGRAVVRDGHVQYLQPDTDTAVEVDFSQTADGAAVGSPAATSPTAPSATRASAAGGASAAGAGASTGGAPAAGASAAPAGGSPTDRARHDQTAPAGDRLMLHATGRLRGERLDARGTGGSILRLRDDTQPYPVSIDGRLGQTRVKADGQIVQLASLSAFDADLTVSGPTLEAIGKAFDVAIPGTPPYQLTGHLTHRDALWRVERLVGKVGDSDLGGTVEFDSKADGRPRPLLTTTLVLQRLDFDDLAPLLGLPPRTGPGQTASAEQRRQAQQMQARSQALPAKPFDTAKWRKFDAKVSLDAKAVTHAPALPVNAFSTRFELIDGVAKASPIAIGLAGGQATGHLTLDGRNAPLSGSVRAQFAGLKLDRMFPTVQKMRGSLGTLYGQLELESKGDSVKALLGEADGSVYMAMAGGQISNMLIEAAGLDAGELIKYFVRGDREIRIRCAVADLAVRDGVASVRTMLFDTTDSKVIGSGQIDLAHEQLGLTFQVRPKDRSILSARAPLHVTGPLRKPSVAPDTGALATRGLAAVALAAINPLLALLPTIETGPGEDANCRKVLAEAPEFTQQGAEKAAARIQNKLPPDTSKQAEPSESRAPGRAARAGGPPVGAAANYPHGSR